MALRISVGNELRYPEDYNTEKVEHEGYTYPVESKIVPYFELYYDDETPREEGHFYADKTDWNVVNIIRDYTVQAINAADDAEYEKIVNEMVSKAKEAGYDEVVNNFKASFE